MALCLPAHIDPEVASDAVAEAFAQLIRRGDEVRDPRAWVWRSAFRIADRDVPRAAGQPPPLEMPTYELPTPSWTSSTRSGACPASRRRSCCITFLIFLSPRSPRSSARARAR